MVSGHLTGGSGEALALSSDVVLMVRVCVTSRPLSAVLEWYKESVYRYILTDKGVVHNRPVAPGGGGGAIAPLLKIFARIAHYI